MWVTKMTAAAIPAAMIALWLCKKAWLRKHPEKVIMCLEKRLMKNVRERRAARAMLADWNLLCKRVKQEISEENPSLAQRGAETIKLFVGEYFGRGLDNSKINTAIYRELAALYAASIAEYPELATEMVVALRVAAREIMERDKDAFDRIVRQFTVYGLLALRERRYYFAAKIFDQIFLLIPRCFSKGLAEQQRSVLRAIGNLGQSVIRRRDNGLIRDVVARLKQCQDSAGRLIHEPIYDMILKSVRTGSPDTLDILLETSRSILASENETEVRNTLRVWAEAAKNAVMKQEEASLGKIIGNMVRATEESLPNETISLACLDELFAVLSFAIRGKTVSEQGKILFPVLEFGCLCMQRELKYGLMDKALKSYQGILRSLLDKLIHLGALVTRNGQTVTGAWVAQVYCQWAKVPDNAYRKDLLLKFVQLWLLYWMNCQRKTAMKQGGLPHELFVRQRWSRAELERFPNLHIRSVEM